MLKITMAFIVLVNCGIIELFLKSCIISKDKLSKYTFSSRVESKMQYLFSSYSLTAMFGAATTG